MVRDAAAEVLEHLELSEAPLEAACEAEEPPAAERPGMAFQFKQRFGEELGAEMEAWVPR